MTEHAETVAGRDALQKAYNAICGAINELWVAVEIIGSNGDLTATQDDLRDARERLAPIAFPHLFDGRDDG